MPIAAPGTSDTVKSKTDQELGPVLKKDRTPWKGASVM